MREFAQKRGVRYAVTNGFAAAAMGGAIEGGALELYCEPLTNTMLAELRIMPTQKQADLYIAVPKDEWILKRTTGIQGCLYVNAVQLYGDLLAARDARLNEAAKHVAAMIIGG